MVDEIYKLTTSDNPYSPFTEFDSWWAYDRIMGYYTLEYLARIAHTSPELSIEDNIEIIDEAINEIVAMNITGNYKKVKESDYKERDTERNAVAS